MAVCPVCGCKTQDIDFVNHKINSKEVKVCYFCDKQLEKLEKGNPDTAEIRWLNAVVNKEVPERDGDITNSLVQMKALFPEVTPEVKTAPAEDSVFHTSPNETFVSASPSDFSAEKSTSEDVVSREYVYSLETRIKKMEAYIDRFKKMQLIKTVLEIVIPIILALIILIIFLTSGLPDYFRQISDLAKMTNCVRPFFSSFYGGF